MYILDSDIVSIVIWRREDYQRVLERLQPIPAGMLFTSIITVNELLEGTAGLIRRSARTVSAMSAYDRLGSILSYVCHVDVLPFDDPAYATFASFPASAKRVGTNDCRIAAIAISRGMTVVTRNSRDFDRIPGVKHEDWTV